LKKLIILALIAYGVWDYNTKNSDNISITSSSIKSSKSISNSDTRPSYQEEPSYQCDGREYCSQMGSYEEAKFFIDHCPNTKMDGNNDGVPCERQFGR